jgi:hypothetical protein
MDHLTVVTSVGKSVYLAPDNRSRLKIVKRERIVTTTGVQLSRGQHKRQQLYLTLAGPLVK